MKVVAIAGPTATGKTAMAVELACLYGATIVSADAMLVYRGLDVGTAKPPPVVLRRYPHACVDVRSPDEEFSVADFSEAVAAARSDDGPVVVVGGTHFYIAALERPLAPLPEADASLRSRLEGLENPHEALVSVDPALAEKLHPNDRMRIIRALEVHALTGRPLSELQKERTPAPDPDVCVFWLDRDDVDERIDRRLQRMVERGYVAEVRRALERYGPDIKPLRAFAFRHIVDHITQGLDLDEAIRRTSRDTRRFVRKQRTWARNRGWATVDRDAIRDAVGELWAPR